LPENTFNVIFNDFLPHPNGSKSLKIIAPGVYPDKVGRVGANNDFQQSEFSGKHKLIFTVPKIFFSFATITNKQIY
jgi:hypothetical protein